MRDERRDAFKKSELKREELEAEYQGGWPSDEVSTSASVEPCCADTIMINEKQDLKSPTEGRAKPLRFQVDEQELEQARKFFSNLKAANGENSKDNSGPHIENSIEEELKGQTCGEANEGIQQINVL